MAHEVCDVGAKPIGSRKVENGVDGPYISAPLVKLCHLFKMYLITCHMWPLSIIAFDHIVMLLFLNPFHLKFMFLILSRCCTCDLSKSLPQKLN
jgi:hypothetical protein